MVHRQQIQNAALAAGKSGHLPVDGVAAQRGVQGFDLGARLRFQPRLGILAVERMIAVRRLGRAGAVEFFHQALDFRRVMVAGGAPLAQPEEQVAAGEFGEFDAAHAQAGASIVSGDALHAGQRGDLLPAVRRCWARGGGRGPGGYPGCRGRADRRAAMASSSRVGEEFEAGGLRRRGRAGAARRRAPGRRECRAPALPR